MPMGHVITLTFTHDTPEHVFTTLSASLDKLASACQGIESYWHGKDLRLRETTADYAVTAIFRDHDAFTAYLAAPAHVRLNAELVQPYLAEKSSVQFDVPATTHP
ncbi:Dabb family protein [Rhodococcus sp. B50]|uniref:Dabb family protein n=1 Tax=Rhodococcus sp. B50 TaxID=2682847 RepID=UPI001BD40ED1|nr:Dabb family protein [Rhodococcus sp. B50]MBS9376559.1 hypothetical protein [Rhodococcus sp. B50]